MHVTVVFRGALTSRGCEEGLTSVLVDVAASTAGVDEQQLPKFELTVGEHSLILPTVFLFFEISLRKEIGCEVRLRQPRSEDRQEMSSVMMVRLYYYM